jgi:bifunctional UDP-N-acetylglucosamine pyrophosphorylase/glucosamine-1-phosphate N-acetyltransferase
MASQRPLACIILAAGKGTRMKSAMLGHVIRSAQSLDPAKIVVVLAPGMDEVAAYAAPHTVAIQEAQQGTAHAVMAAQAALEAFEGDIMILLGDQPLYTPETMRRMADGRHANGANHAIVMLGMRPADPRAYGRMIEGPHGLERIVEFADANEAERKVNLVWAGMMVADARIMFDLLKRIGKDNAQGEYYLTSIIAEARKAGHACGVIEVAEEESAAVNSRNELAIVERIMQERLRAQAMKNGATLLDPATTYFSLDTQLGRDVILEPNVVFGPGVSIGDNVTIKAFSHIEGASIRDGAIIGPFARLRPNSEVGAGAHVGNFVELKNTTLGIGTRANHFAYLGDATIGGSRTNIGAGTIVCNYDGYDKFRTTIGENVMIGSNSTLVSPVVIGDGSFVAAGSVITENVPADAMAFGRARQVNKPGRGAAFRAVKQRSKDSVS